MCRLLSAKPVSISGDHGV